VVSQGVTDRKSYPLLRQHSLSVSAASDNQAKQLPIFYLPKEQQNEKGPHYPSIKMNVNQFQQDVADILEESYEERRRESIQERKMSKIKRIMSPLQKSATGDVRIEIEEVRQ